MENKNWTKRIVLALTVMVTLTGLYATVGKHRMKEYQACKNWHQQHSQVMDSSSEIKK